MTISTVDLFSVGIGPSSSHTVGPMRAALAYTHNHRLTPDDVVLITLHGSLAATGSGHGTDRAALLGLVGYDPVTVPADVTPIYGDVIAATGTMAGPKATISYHISFSPEPLPQHPNAITFAIQGQPETAQTFFSVGGGFILSEEEFDQQHATPEDLGTGASTTGHHDDVPYPFETGDDLLRLTRDTGLSVPEVMMANEIALHGSEKEVISHLDLVWTVMQECVQAGIENGGVLPGGLNVTRRAPAVHAHVKANHDSRSNDVMWALEWVNLFALAVNEENAAGGRVVTAPTNGAAGIIPAVLHYARDFRSDFSYLSHREFLLTAAAIGIIIKNNASISGAEVGCQGEVGSACAMAAAGLAQVMGASPYQVEHAAEIALEHNLGLTCDPVGGLVQVPCIERNAIGAVKAINAARMAKLSAGQHLVSLDDVVKTMADTGRDMLTKYKETATGGLAVNLGFPVNLTEC